MTECCPKLEELTIGRRSSSGSSIFSSSHEPDMTIYSSIGNLKLLVKLSLNDVEFTRGDFLKPVITFPFPFNNNMTTDLSFFMTDYRELYSAGMSAHIRPIRGRSDIP